MSDTAPSTPRKPGGRADADGTTQIFVAESANGTPLATRLCLDFARHQVAAPEAGRRATIAPVTLAPNDFTQLDLSVAPSLRTKT
jgi:hypothetical protein